MESKWLAKVKGSFTSIRNPRKAVPAQRVVTKDTQSPALTQEVAMAFADMTPEQQQIVTEYVRQVRAVIGEFARLLNHFEAMDYMYDGQVTAAWAALLNTDVIADGSGLAGVSELTKAQITTLATGMDAVLTTYNTAVMRQLFVRVAGMTNTIG